MKIRTAGTVRTRFIGHAALVIATAAPALLAQLAPAWARDRIERVSVGPGGVQGNGESNFLPAISADGRFVAFISSATNLVPADTNGAADVFVRDRRSDTTERVSVGPRGVQSNADNFAPRISPGGRFVAFTSMASNLVPGDTNETWDVFVRDRKLGTTQRASVGPGGVQANSAGGFGSAISAGGRFIAFESDASNLVPGDTNDRVDVFVRDRQAGCLRRNRAKCRVVTTRDRSSVNSRRRPEQLGAGEVDRGHDAPQRGRPAIVPTEALKQSAAHGARRRSATPPTVSSGRPCGPGHRNGQGRSGKLGPGRVSAISSSGG
jgi:hypothetical protein